MRGSERTRLLHGRYRAPSLRVGDRATCLLKDGDVVAMHNGGSGIVYAGIILRWGR